MQPSEIWEVALGELQTHVSHVLFQTHLQGTTVLEYKADNHELVISCLTDNAQAWAEQRLSSTVDRILTGITGQPLSARFVSLQVQSVSAEAVDADEVESGTWLPDWPGMGIPPRFVAESLETLDWKQAALQSTELREYIDQALDYWQAGIGLMLMGPVGVGKTHVAIGLGKFAVQQGLTFTFVSAAAFLERLWKSYDGTRVNHWAKSEEQIIDDLAQCDLLALDDLRVDGLTPWSRSKFLKLINRRWEGRAPIVVTSNFTLNELAYPNSQLGFDAAMLSRLVGSTIRLTLSGDDFRLKHKYQAVDAVRRQRIPA
jgi:DNA replication protein DnaC